MTFMTLLVTLCLWVTLTPVVGVSLKGGGGKMTISLINNGYSGLTIAIHPDVPEDISLIDSIQILLTRVSEELYHKSTRRRAFYRDVTILIPSTWSDSPNYLPAIGHTVRKSHVIIKPSKLQLESPPYTRQTSGCGDPGLEMHLPLHVLKESSSDLTLHAKRFIHDWAHLRWGVFDERPLAATEQQFYFSQSGSILPAHCSTYVQGRITSGTCDINQTSGLPTNCVYTTTDPDQSAASLMSHEHLSHVETFCGISGEAPYLHNAEAPNLQNTLCQGRSAWDVIKLHEDFAHGVNSQMSSDVMINTTPTFYIRHQGADHRIVLVIDRSGSMQFDKRIHRVADAMGLFVRYLLPEGASVAVVSFSAVAFLEHDLTRITSNADREALIQALPRTVLGLTCTGCGLQKAAEILEADTAGSGGTIVLLSDGKQADGFNITISKATQGIVASGFTVHSILLTDPDPSLIPLADQTGGRTYFEPGHNWNYVTLYEALVDIQQNILRTADNESQVWSWAGNITDLPLDLPVTEIAWPPTIYVASFQTIQPQASNQTSPEVDILDSTGVVTQTLGFTPDASLPISVLQVPSQPQSNSTYRLKATGPPDVGIHVIMTSQPAADDTQSPGNNVELQAFVLSDKLNFVSNDPMAKTLMVYAVLTWHDLPVEGASVNAVITGVTDGWTETVSLQDTGLGSDLVRGDGVYSCYFTQFLSGGVFYVKVYASSPHTQAWAVASSWHRPSQHTAQDSPQRWALGGFRRQASAGVVNVVGYPDPRPVPWEDQYPPAQVRDLRVVSLNKKDKSVLLQWTQMGDDWDQGTIAGVDARWSVSAKALREDFARATELQLGHSLPGQAAMQVQVTLTFPDLQTTAFIGLKLRDEVPHWSSLSNIVSVSFNAVLDEGIFLVDKPNGTKEPIGVDHTLMYILIASVGGSLFLLAFVVCILFCCCLKNRRKTTDEQPTPAVQMVNVPKESGAGYPRRKNTYVDNSNQPISVIPVNVSHGLVGGVVNPTYIPGQSPGRSRASPTRSPTRSPPGSPAGSPAGSPQLNRATTFHPPTARAPAKGDQLPLVTMRRGHNGMSDKTRETHKLVQVNRESLYPPSPVPPRVARLRGQPDYTTPTSSIYKDHVYQEIPVDVSDSESYDDIQPRRVYGNINHPQGPSRGTGGDSDCYDDVYPGGRNIHGYGNTSSTPRPTYGAQVRTDGQEGNRPGEYAYATNESMVNHAWQQGGNNGNTPSSQDYLREYAYTTNETHVPRPKPDTATYGNVGTGHHGGDASQDRVYGNIHSGAMSQDQGAGSQDRVYGNIHSGAMSQDQGAGSQDRVYGNIHSGAASQHAGLASQDRVYGNVPTIAQTLHGSDIFRRKNKQTFRESESISGDAVVNDLMDLAAYQEGKL